MSCSLEKGPVAAEPVGCRRVTSARTSSLMRNTCATLRDQPFRGRTSCRQVVHFGHQQVFTGATTYTCLLFLHKAPGDQFDFVRVDNLDAWVGDGIAVTGAVGSDEATARPWNFSVGSGACAVPVRFRKCLSLWGQWQSESAQGIRTSANEVYVVNIVSSRRNDAEVSV